MKQSNESLIRNRLYTIRLVLWSQKDYREEYNVTPSEIEKVIENQFIRHLEKYVSKEITLNGRKKSMKIVMDSQENNNIHHGDQHHDDDDDIIGKPLGSFKNRSFKNGRDADRDDEDMDDVLERKSKKGKEIEGHDADDDDDDLDEDDENEMGEDGGYEEAKRIHKRAQHTSYDDPDEDDEEVIRDMNEKMKHDEDDQDEDEDDDDEQQENNGRSRRLKSTTNRLSMFGESSERSNRILERSKYVTGYKFDKEGGSWCEINLEVSKEE